MAPIGGGPPNRRGPSLNRSIMIDTVRGTPRARAWPKKRGSPKSPAQRFAVEEFKRASDLTKRLDGAIMAELYEAADGTPFYPRDLAFMAMFGRMLAVTDNYGRLYRTRAMTDDVSKSLDLITDVPGSYLVRGPEGWIGASSPEGFASWFANGIFSSEVTGLSSSAWAWKGPRFRAITGMTIFGAMIYCDFVESAEYQVVVARLGGSLDIVDIQRSPIVTAPENGAFFLRFDVGQELLADEEYAVMLGRIDATGTYALPVKFLSQRTVNFPAELTGYARLAKLTPAIGDVVDTGGGEQNTVFAQFQLTV